MTIKTNYVNILHPESFVDVCTLIKMQKRFLTVVETVTPLDTFAHCMSSAGKKAIHYENPFLCWTLVQCFIWSNR